MTKVLIAEDEAFLADLYKMNLEAAGMSVTVAHDGKEAIAMLQREKFDLLLLDLLMPETDGFAVLEWIKAQKGGKRFAVIVLTNLSGELNQEKCHKLGADECVIKSNVEVNDILKLVAKHVPAS